MIGFAFERSTPYNSFVPRNRTWTDEALRDVVPKCMTYSQVAVSLGLYPGNKTCKRVRDRIEELGIDTSHFSRIKQSTCHPGRRGWNVPDDRFFVRGKAFNASHRRRYLEMVEYKCELCGISDWMGEYLILQIDHVDGDRSNNTLENLRLLCPNCHSQTPTWAKQKRKE